MQRQNNLQPDDAAAAEQRLLKTTGEKSFLDYLPNAAANALLRRLLAAATWEEVLEAAVLGIHAISRPTVVLAGGRLDNVREWVLGLPEQWLDLVHTPQILQQPHVRHLVDIAVKQAACAGEDLRPDNCHLLALDVTIAQERMKTPPVETYVHPIQTEKARGLLAFSDPTHKLSAPEIQRLLKMLSDILAPAIDRVAKLLEYEALALQDDLTGLYNRRAFLKSLGEHFATAKRYGRPLSLVMLDLDNFKSINDRYGHLAGDSVLRRVGQVLKNGVREADVVARIGGDEFAILCPETTADGAGEMLSRLMENLSSVRLPSGESVSAKAGVAQLRDQDMSIQELFACADVALYRAKKSGQPIVIFEANRQ